MLATATVLAADPVDFNRDVQPILQKYCVGCHTADDAEGGLVMESHQSLLTGGDSGVVVTAGEAASSRLLLMLNGELDPQMPPEGEQRPSEDEIERLSQWIEQGALGPQGDMPLKREIRAPKIPRDQAVALPVTAVAFSPDGEKRAVARYGRIDLVREDDSIATTITQDLNKVNSIVFSRDGSRLLVASGETGAYGSALIFAVATGETLLELVGHRDVLYSAVFSPDESIIATGGYDREIILWDAHSGQAIRSLKGHNGAIFDLAFSPDGKLLVSGCADETAKVWRVADGKRLDTLSQPEGEVFAVDVTPDGRFILAASSDNRLRVWALRSKTQPRINPIRATRFVDESPLVNFEITPDGRALVVLSDRGNVKVMRTTDWNHAATLEPLGETGSDLSVSPDGKTIAFSLMDGRVVRRQMPDIGEASKRQATSLPKVYLDLGELTKIDEADQRSKAAANASLASQVNMESPIDVARGVEINGTVSQPGQADLYRWQARAGEVWAIDGDAADNSMIDPIVSVLDSNLQPIIRTRLQAIRDSYFTFRGKNSSEISDFRLFNWQEMQLNDYLYAAGEVTRFWLYPRGPDSGYNVYPNEGKRWTYFGTSHMTHALGEPAYIVRPIAEGESAIPNGLPVFDVFYENDDDPMRIAGNNSRLLFTAPADGTFVVRIADTRGAGGDDFGYRLRVRAAEPAFKPSVSKVKGKILRGAGREFIVRVDRVDGFDGPVTFDIPQLPPGLIANTPLTIEQGQRYAVGTVWASEHTADWQGKLAPEVIATATVAGRRVERRVGTIGELTLGDRPKAIPSIHPVDRMVAEDENWTLTLRRGETVSARVIVRRTEGFTNEISFGKENSGRNAPHGVYVDNIGLNGLLVRTNENEREFFLTADRITKPGKRLFFVTGAVDGGVTTHPITVEVLE